MKHLGMNLANDVKDIKTRRHSREKLNKTWLNIERYSVFLDTFNVVEVSILKMISEFNAISIKILAVFFLGVGERWNWQANTKIHVKVQRTYNSQNNFDKEQYGGLALLDFKTYYKTPLIKIVWYWNNDRQIDQ